MVLTCRDSIRKLQESSSSTSGSAASSPRPVKEPTTCDQGRDRAQKGSAIGLIGSKIVVLSFADMALFPDPCIHTLKQQLPSGVSS